MRAHDETVTPHGNPAIGSLTATTRTGTHDTKGDPHVHRMLLHQRHPHDRY